MIFKLSMLWIMCFTTALGFSFVSIDSNKNTPHTSQQPEINLEVQKILDYCKNPDEGVLNNCFREKSKKLVLNTSAAQTIVALQSIYTNDSQANYSMKIACHSLGHIAGEIDGQYSQNVGESLSKCTPDCGNACYHGILIGALKTHQDLLNNLESICSSFSQFDFPGQQLTACNHGLGHGLSEFTGNDTKASLNYCDGLKTEVAKIECGSGVFMESIDDLVSGQAGIKLPEDIGPFCLELNQPYKDLCMRNIGNYKHRTTNNTPMAFQACMELTGEYVDSCIGSLGSDFFFITRGNISELTEVCKNIPAKQDICLRGAIISSLVTDPYGNLSVEICNSFKAGGDDCLLQLSSHLLRLQGRQYRDEFCNKFVYNNKQACLSI